MTMNRTTKMGQFMGPHVDDLDVGPSAQYLQPSLLSRGRKKDNGKMMKVSNDDLSSSPQMISMTVIPNLDDDNYFDHQNFTNNIVVSSSSRTVKTKNIPMPASRKRKQEFVQVVRDPHEDIIFQQSFHDDMASNLVGQNAYYAEDDEGGQPVQTKNKIRKVPMTNYNCTECQKKFTSPEGLRAHSVVHEKKNFVCVLCTKSFTTQNQLLDHFEVVVKKTCAICISKKSAGQPDIEEEEGQQQQFNKTTCPVCSQSFPFETAVNNHLKEEHCEGGGRSPYGCPFDGCLESFQTFYEWKLHVKDGHPWKCTLCPGTSFSSSESRHIHMRCEHDEPCQVCANCQQSLIK